MSETRVWAKSRASRCTAGRIFLDEERQVLRGLVLLAERNRVVFVQDVAVASAQNYLLL